MTGIVTLLKNLILIYNCIMEKLPVGRPRVIQSPEQFDALVDNYIEICRSTGEPILLTGLILSLGLTSKEGFYEYQNYEGFSDSVKRARMFVELEYEKRLVTAKQPSAPIFALKNFGWRDKVEVESTSTDIADALQSIADKLPD